MVAYYFSKWIMVEAITKITDVAIKSSVWKNIFWQFRIPHTIMTDNELLYIALKSRISIKNLKSATSLLLPDIRKQMDKQRIQA